MVTLRLNSMHNRFMVRKSTRDLVPSSWSELWAWKQRPILSSSSADSGFTAALGTPTLCGTGPVGGNAHTDEEWCRIDTIVPRAQALALTTLEVAASPS